MGKFRPKMFTKVVSSLIRIAPRTRSFCSIKYYTESHEWVNFNKSNGTATIGITDHAQNELGDLVHLETIKSGETLGSGDSFCTLESVKGVADAYAPVEAQVTEVNEAAVEEPAKINEDAENCWIV